MGGSSHAHRRSAVWIHPWPGSEAGRADRPEGVGQREAERLADAADVAGAVRRGVRLDDDPRLRDSRRAHVDALQRAAAELRDAVDRVAAGPRAVRRAADELLAEDTRRRRLRREDELRRDDAGRLAGPDPAERELR